MKKPPRSEWRKYDPETHHLSFKDRYKDVPLPADLEWDGYADILFVGIPSYGSPLHQEKTNWWTRTLLLELARDVGDVIGKKGILKKTDLRPWKSQGIQLLVPHGMYTYNLFCYLKYETTHPMAIVLFGKEANNYYGAIKDRENTLVIRLNAPTIHEFGKHGKFRGSRIFSKCAEFVGKPFTIWKI